MCVREEVPAALLRTGDEEADSHYTLRDILATLARVAEIPVRFKVAIVATSGAIAHVYWSIWHELTTLGCDARLFRAEPEAERWLLAGGDPSATAKPVPPEGAAGT